MYLTLQQVGPWGIVALVVAAVVFGYLVPRPLLKETRKVADIWREAYEHEKESRLRAETQRDELLVEYAKTTHLVATALPSAGVGAAGPGSSLAALDPGGDPGAAVAV